MKRYLVLKNGSIYKGNGFGSKKMVHGELVFSTGMTGYQESMTDASYDGQMLVFTYPLIGNYGINQDDMESLHPAVNAIIVKEIARLTGNWRSKMTLQQYAEREDLPGISGIDTRALSKELRLYGSMEAIIVDSLDKKVINDAFKSPLASSSAQLASTNSIYQAPNSGLRVAMIDFGLKDSILRALAKRNVNVIVFPSDTSAEEIMKVDPDGLLLSNGPGNPENIAYALPTIKSLEQQLPVLGICMGHQLFALANGAKTYKMKFGHRGFNHAVKDEKQIRTNFTSQNHGYAVDESSLKGTDLEVTQREINDGTVEGLKLKHLPAFSVQYHPDASPGPHDAEYVFDEFIDAMNANQKVGNK
ncbi:carbamoyl phosphate synthase small subunit [Apilactobacillus timberlakei]|uniref:carbamoyl phosphate synthase small subunit n=1 Tax=Apilactobacillus timberlakei TaxID=2008380 RepID=UPI00112809D8|nr:carbamoyl phosphate synthase small subunit [Apilactobacillus timberlakei]TPR18158.1 carbamoyl phosphate synthase small subunit [Apilactobacillus timberlakei]TPR18912.1 carbamoyl phosphate synthase small subunit [Apilactobacillus timberlakei]TPR20923.1 carbamoyl phosphate synthase small subunit [Apilactobacillus timberlakei]TPR23574.1 carbamoyl phosphate synthase small subunit [Apilactobacillus timberlakei]